MKFSIAAHGCEAWVRDINWVGVAEPKNYRVIIKVWLWNFTNSSIFKIELALSNNFSIKLKIVPCHLIIVIQTFQWTIESYWFSGHNCYLFNWCTNQSWDLNDFDLEILIVFKNQFLTYLITSVCWSQFVCCSANIQASVFGLNCSNFELLAIVDHLNGLSWIRFHGFSVVNPLNCGIRSSGSVTRNDQWAIFNHLEFGWFGFDWWRNWK